MKNAIVALVRGYEDVTRYEKLIARNRAIVKNVLPKINEACDLILFHEGNIPGHHQFIINEKSGAEFKFIDLRITPPFTAFNKFKEEKNYVEELASTTSGYRHMCKFWFMDFIEYLSDYKYVARIDEDILVYSTEDFFLDMSNKNIIFKTPGILPEPSIACIGLIEFCKFILAKNREYEIKVPEQVYAPMTNITLFDVQSIRVDNTFNKFSQDIDRIGAIYTHRWGDHILWYFFLKMYVEENKYQFSGNDISYYHESHDAFMSDGVLKLVAGKIAYSVW